MWHAVTSIPHPLDSFGIFLDSSEYRAYVAEQIELNMPRPSVLDIVERWLAAGGIELFASFDAMLVAIIEMTGEWVESDNRTISDVPLWPHPTSGEALPIRQFLSSDHKSAEAVGIEHPVLVSEHFERLRDYTLWQRREKQHQEILAALGRTPI